MKGKKAIIALFIIFLVFLIICPLLSIFAEAVFQEGRFSLESAIETITESENAAMIGSSLLLGLLVVIVSSIIALPLAYLFSRTQLARYRFDGMDPVHAEKRADAAALPLACLHYRLVLLPGWPCHGDELPRLSVHDDDDEERNAIRTLLA